MPWHGGGGGTHVPRQLPLVRTWYLPYHTIPYHFYALSCHIDMFCQVSIVVDEATVGFRLTHVRSRSMWLFGKKKPRGFAVVRNG